MAIAFAAGACRVVTTPIGEWVGAETAADAAPDAPTDAARRDARMVDGGVFQPSLATTFDWQLASPIDTTSQADVYDLDLFNTSPEEIADLHAMGSHAICYVSMGVVDTQEAVAAGLDMGLLGNPRSGRPNRRSGMWLDIRQVDVVRDAGTPDTCDARCQKLRQFFVDRLRLCKGQGFDGVDPDDLDAWQFNTGFPISGDDQIAFDAWLAAQAHALKLLIGLHNDFRHFSRLYNDFDWVVAERCHQDALDNFCPQLSVLTSNGKPAFAVEYDDRFDATQFSAFCPQFAADHIFGLLKHPALDGYQKTCR